MVRVRILIIAALLCGAMKTAAQGFFNLTAEQVRIDSLLPCFTWQHKLPGNYADSVYTVTIEYPEFVPMTQADIRRYQAITADSLPPLPVVSSQLSVSRKQGMLDISFVPLVFRDGRMQKLVSFKLNVSAQPMSQASVGDAQGLYRVRAAAETQQAADRYADHSVLRSGSWAKIRVPRSGLYQITDELVSRAGFADPSRVRIYGYGGALQPETLTGSYLQETDDLQEVPTCTVGGRRLFYAQGSVTWTAAGDRVRNPYSDYGYYFLTESDGTPLTVGEDEFVSSFYPGDGDFQNTLYEVDNYAWFHSGRNLYDSQTFTSGKSVDYTLDAVGAAGAGTLRVVLTADAASSARISVNDSLVGTVNVSKPDDLSLAAAGSSTFKLTNISQTNKVTITQATGGTMRLDYILLRCSEPGGRPDLSSVSVGTPEYLYHITNQDHHADTPTDMIILLPTTQRLRTQAERLKLLHEQEDGLTVRIVSADELYNEFSSGTPDATAYRRYLKMFYDRAETDADIPKYLVLFGDGAWDNRMLSDYWRGQSPDDFLLCFESENSFSQVLSYVSDDFFCMLDDGEYIQSPTNSTTGYTGKADVAVGRFPVRTEEEAKVMVDKIVSYVGNENAGAWQNTLVFMGDDGNQNSHMIAADKLAAKAEAINPGFDVKRIMWDAYTRTSSTTGYSYPDVTRLIKQYMTNGALIMHYCGHGSPTIMSHEKVLQINDFSETKSANLPLWITASCDISPFDGQEDNIGETALFNSGGGAVAFIGTARTVYTTRNETLGMALVNVLLTVGDDGLGNGIGEALRLTKNAMVTPVSTGQGTSTSMPDNTQNKLHYVLLGDPALRLALPKLTAVIDSVNGQPVGSGDVVQLKAGMQVSVKGHIEEGGVKADTFSGELTAIVRDAQQLVECRLNNTDPTDGATTKFTYYDRPATIFKGSDNVSGGEFAFSFVVPKDISYSDEQGQVVVFAIDEAKTRSANGMTDILSFNGSVDFRRDSIGPAIYCYLNSTSFTNGDNVNSTPYFVAELNDDDGINAAGSGIGHDLQLIIDGDMARTYVLNDYFTFDFGTYKSGRVGYSIPRLDPGPHKLLFRAWDVLNYSSSAELTFNVVEGTEPRIVDVDCTPNPAVTSTTFRIVHDRIGSAVEAVLDIYDMSGRHLWSQTASATPSDNVMTISWDLTVGDGRRLGTGVYIYRVRLNCEGGSYASKAKKLIVLCNK